MADDGDKGEIGFGISIKVAAAGCETWDKSKRECLKGVRSYLETETQRSSNSHTPA